MRILVATDGSGDAGRAVELAGAQAWPPGTELRVLVVDDGNVVSEEALGGDPPVRDVWDAGVEDLAGIADRAGQVLRERGWPVVTYVIAGPAAETIVAEAGRLHADLVVVGSRGRGGLQEIALGSVTAAVVDTAGRPVLVARTDSPFSRVVLADDGSDAAATARRMVADWPAFATARIGVVSVAPIGVPLLPAVAPATWWPGVEAYEAADEAAQRGRDRILAEACAELTAAGRTVSILPHQGNPASEILEAAAQQRADLIIMGSRGETGIARLVLGSVARDVVHAASCSVLIAR